MNTYWLPYSQSICVNETFWRAQRFFHLPGTIRYYQILVHAPLFIAFLIKRFTLKTIIVSERMELALLLLVLLLVGPSLETQVSSTTVFDPNPTLNINKNWSDSDTQDSRTNLTFFSLYHLLLCMIDIVTKCTNIS